MKSITGSVVLVTGANRGLGLAFVQELLEQGAAKVYAATRKTHDFGDARVVNIPLDLTDQASIKKLAELAPDAAVVINNAGVFLETSIVGADMEKSRLEFETNVFGPMQVAQVMAPVLKNAEGVIINIVSVGAWLPLGSYAASKAALWSVTNTLRQELKGQETQVVGVYVGPIDTDMVRGMDVPKHDPVEVARAALKSIESGENEVLVDDFSTHIKSLLSGPVEDLVSPI